MDNRPRQAGFGLLESLIGLVVFALLGLVCTKAFHGIVANHKESAQMKALTDAVMETAEKLSALTIPTLTAASNGYTAWSAPQAVGMGTYVFRYRIVPHPTVSGAVDTTVVGLEVETGSMVGGAFAPVRSFATLIAPHLNSKDKLGQVSTAKEREQESLWHASLLARLSEVAMSTVSENQDRLNSFSCYDKGQCCPFMEKYFMDPKLRPKDGVDQKCLYRCALGGNVHVKEWTKACGKDFCSLAPWKDKASCCAAIAAGECKPGTVCANVCIDCVGEDGSTCKPAVCDEGYFNDFFDCANQKLCNGQDLPIGSVPDWGDVRALCKVPKCAAIKASCQDLAFSCCNGYWQRIADGMVPFLGTALCPDMVKKEECCNTQIGAGYFNFVCTTDGKVAKSQYYNKGTWYCGSPPGSDWDKYCKVNSGCPSTFQTTGSTSGCESWNLPPLADPWQDPDPSSPGTHGFKSSFTGTGDGTTTSVPATSTDSKARDASQRNGNTHNSQGGHE